MLARSASGAWQYTAIDSLDDLDKWDNAVVSSLAPPVFCQPLRDRFSKCFRPRLLVCHDMMGGYLEGDCMVQGEGLKLRWDDSAFHIKDWQEFFTKFPLS